MPYSWDDANQKQLLLAVIQLTKPGPPKWEQVAKMLGDGCTGEGARKQFAKLKNSANDAFGEAYDAGEHGQKETKTAGKGLGKKAVGDSALKPKSKRKAVKVVEEAAEDDDDDEAEPQAKKVKAGAVKAEDE